MPELKHCPFCGSKEIVVSDSGSGMYAYCKSCYAIGTHISYDGDKWDATCKAIEAWNMRYEPTCTMELQYALEERSNVFCFVCSNCGHDVFGEISIKHCPECGALVEAVD